MINLILWRFYLKVTKPEGCVIGTGQNKHKNTTLVRCFWVNSRLRWAMARVAQYARQFHVWLHSYIIPELKPSTDVDAWAEIDEAVLDGDPWCRTIVLFGLEGTADELEAAFMAASRQSSVRDFAVGRTIFADVARGWFAGELDAEAAVSVMAENYRGLCRMWD